MLDGGEAEICQRVGSDNFFLWSTKLKPCARTHGPCTFYGSDPELRGAVGLVAGRRL